MITRKIKAVVSHAESFFKFIGMWNTMNEVAGAMIEVSKNGYHKAAIECRDISRLAKQ